MTLNLYVENRYRGKLKIFVDQIKTKLWFAGKLRWNTTVLYMKITYATN